jgi:hypothetical protein
MRIALHCNHRADRLPAGRGGLCRASRNRKGGPCRRARPGGRSARARRFGGGPAGLGNGTRGIHRGRGRRLADRPSLPRLDVRGGTRGRARHQRGHPLVCAGGGRRRDGLCRQAGLDVPDRGRPAAEPGRGGNVVPGRDSRGAFAGTHRACLGDHRRCARRPAHRACARGPGAARGSAGRRPHDGVVFPGAAVHRGNRRAPGGRRAGHSLHADRRRYRSRADAGLAGLHVRAGSRHASDLVTAAMWANLAAAGGDRWGTTSARSWRIRWNRQTSRRRAAGQWHGHWNGNNRRADGPASGLERGDASC